MSSAPTGSSAPPWARIAEAIRRASGTPRRWMPTRTRPSVPACFSTISWEMRTIARRISSAVMIRRPVIGASLGAGDRARWLLLPASRDQDPGSRGRTEGVGPSLASVDLDGHLGRARKPPAAADREEIGLVHVDDPAGRRSRAVVVHDPLDAAALAADDDRGAARDA